MLKFPDKFYWGTATSSYQVEGGIKNDWSRLSGGQAVAGKNYDAGLACDHYNRFEEDFDLAKSMNNNAHRFSIEWARVEPEQGKFDQQEIEHYRKVILALKQRGLEPFVTLYHWTLPIWFVEKGGWLNKDAPKYFEEFVGKVVSEYRDLVKFWITLNEPNIYASHAYLQGNWPPFKRGLNNFNKAMFQLVEAHKLAFNKIHEISNHARVGIASNNIWYRGIIKLFLDYRWNYWFFDKIKNCQDFVGVNYYFSNSLSDYIFSRPKITDLGWKIVPEGVYRVLVGVKKYNKPVYVFENGLADKNDTKREKFIIDHLKWIHKAIEDGVDVKGYFHWSLIDNFEWDKGFGPRFGLIGIDYEDNLKRIPRPSSKIYSEICKNNAI
ncbi:MAG: glycoside hydrolase family 1 protein [Patescibacteria group bacterium]